MNKHDLIDAISGQLGSKKTATDAVKLAKAWTGVAA